MPPEGPPEAPPEDPAEGPVGGENHVFWLHFTQKKRNKYNLDSHKFQREETKRLQFTQEKYKKQAVPKISLVVLPRTRGP